MSSHQNSRSASTQEQPSPELELTLVDVAPTHRDSRHADRQWNPANDKSHRPTVAGIAPPGTASAATPRVNRVSLYDTVRSLPSNPKMSMSARARFAIRLLVVAVCVVAYMWFTQP